LQIKSDFPLLNGFCTAVISFWQSQDGVTVASVHK
jgi:hypothetical protein